MSLYTFHCHGRDFVITVDNGDSSAESDNGADFDKSNSMPRSLRQKLNWDLADTRMSDELGVDSEGQLETALLMGGRGLSIHMRLENNRLEKIWDSGSTLEELEAEFSPSTFNPDHKGYYVFGYKDANSGYEGPAPLVLATMQCGSRLYFCSAAEYISSYTCFSLDLSSPVGPWTPRLEGYHRPYPDYDADYYEDNYYDLFYQRKLHPDAPVTMQLVTPDHSPFGEPYLVASGTESDSISTFRLRLFQPAALSLGHGRAVPVPTVKAALTATGRVTVLADGQVIAESRKPFPHVLHLHVPLNTHVLAVKVSGIEPYDGNRGFMMSLQQGGHTDDRWRCTINCHHDDWMGAHMGQHWQRALITGRNWGKNQWGHAKGISRNARWIWAQDFYRQTTGQPRRNAHRVYCKRVFQRSDWFSTRI